MPGMKKAQIGRLTYIEGDSWRDMADVVGRGRVRRGRRGLAGFGAARRDEAGGAGVDDDGQRRCDYRAFFAQFEEFHRILKPGGFFCATCPSYRSEWAWGDPSHTRVITSGTLLFLSQAEYRRQVGKTPMSDFRSIYKADFDIVHCDEDEERLTFALKAIK